MAHKAHERREALAEAEHEKWVAEREAELADFLATVTNPCILCYDVRYTLWHPYKLDWVHVWPVWTKDLNEWTCNCHCHGSEGQVHVRIAYA